MADESTTSYPQLPEEPQESWLAQNRRSVILGGILVLIVAAIGVTAFLRRSTNPPTTNNINSRQNTNIGNTTSTPSQSFRRYTISTPPDQDQDGLSDADEERRGTDPKKADTDGDLLSDYDEVMIYKTDPHKQDSDGDGVPDGLEVRAGTNPAGSGPLLDTNRAIHQIVNS